MGHLHHYPQSNGEAYRGGKYGFVSSHAANFGAMVSFIIASFKPQKKFILLLVIAHLLVIYSRIYLGVHYVGDLVAGSILGVVCGLSISHLYKFVLKKIQPQ
jgi:undecaprenyl-diphosphatase